MKSIARQATLATMSLAIAFNAAAHADDEAAVRCTEEQFEDGFEILEAECEGPGIGVIYCDGDSILVEVDECFD